MPQSPTQDNLVRTIRLDDEAIKALLDRLDEESSAVPGGHESYPYRLKRCVMHMQQPGSSSSTGYLVATRRLSAGGLSVLHGGFVHTGTRCVAQLISTHGSWMNAAGAVTDCHYVSGSMHELIVTFDHSIDPVNFCPEAVVTRVLVVEDDPFVAKLLTVHLTQLNAQVECAENGAVAVEKALNGNYDVILMDIEMPVLNGLDATRKLREAGYGGMIVATTALTRPEDSEHCLEAGCDRYIGKPYSRADLAKLIESLKQEPLFSTYQDEDSMRELINAFVSDLPARVRAVETALSSGELNLLESMARVHTGGAGSYGFEPIAEAAAKLETAIIQSQPHADIQRALDGLIRWCILARSASDADTAPTSS